MKIVMLERLGLRYAAISAGVPGESPAGTGCRIQMVNQITEFTNVATRR